MIDISPWRITIEMTDSEKAKVYDRIFELLQDRVALEKFMRSQGNFGDPITFLRADAYGATVVFVLGRDALPGIRV
jgi:hypothetical protein